MSLCLMVMDPTTFELTCTNPLSGIEVCCYLTKDMITELLPYCNDLSSMIFFIHFSQPDLA